MMAASFQPVVGRKVQFALVGCGRIAEKHIQSILQHHDAAQLVAVCDNNPAALHKAIQYITQKITQPQQSVAAYTNLADMLNDGGFDIVVLATPSGLHARQAIECAAAGFHVMSEKPMATRWQDGLAMVKACDTANVKLFIVKQNRLNPTIQLLKQAIDADRFGKIYNVACNVFWTRPQEYYDQAPWRGTWEFDGGAFMNQASHYVDLLSWLIGPVESVQSYTATQARNIEAEDSGVVALRWRNGALGTMNVSMLTYPQNLEGSITILGEKGTVRIGGVAVNQILVWDFEQATAEDDTIKMANYATNSVYGLGHPLYYANVIKVLQGRSADYVDGHEGLKSLELLISIYRSARDGQRVCLPLESS